MGSVITDYSSDQQETPTDQYTKNQLLADDFGHETLLLELQNDFENIKQTLDFQALSEPGKAVFCEYLSDVAKHFGDDIERHNDLASSRVQSWRRNLGEYSLVSSVGFTEHIDLFQLVNVVDMQASRCLESLYELLNNSGPQHKSFFSNVAPEDFAGIEILADSVLVTKARAFDGLCGIQRKLDVTHERLFQHYEMAQNADFTYAYQAQLARDKMVIMHFGVALLSLLAWVEVFRERSNGHFLWNFSVLVVNVAAVFLYLPPRVVMFCWLFRQHRRSAALFSNTVETLQHYDISGQFPSALRCYLRFNCLNSRLICRELPHDLTKRMSRKEIKSIQDKQKTLSGIMQDTIGVMSKTCGTVTFRIELGALFVSMMKIGDMTYANELAAAPGKMRASISTVRKRANEICSCNSSQAAMWSEAYTSELKRLEMVCIVIAAKLDIFVSVCEPEITRIGDNFQTAFLTDLRREAFFSVLFTAETGVKFYDFMSQLFPDRSIVSVLLSLNPFPPFFSRLGSGLFL